ncbi:hypothetical protein CCR94_00535 [Rhodoblastus sphagnicola]|uniref:Uncharacterized protein n=2 Tax=Rhodoblastus sphagnicola TaxID=333368 RepID=A0A2S6NGT7_9HYPH|nr:hypothetical protein CCR94_00535 [Rhodoblastus sphagnicola]
MIQKNDLLHMVQTPRCFASNAAGCRRGDVTRHSKLEFDGELYGHGDGFGVAFDDVRCRRNRPRI